MRLLLPVALWASLSAPFAAADPTLPADADIWASDVLSQGFETDRSDEECAAMKGELRIDLISRYAGEVRPISLQHAADTIALLCSIIRLSQETRRLEAGISRLDGSILRLEASISRLEASVRRLSQLALTGSAADRAVHEADIAQNQADIAQNRADIEAIRSDIEENRNDIAAIDRTLNRPNTGLIATFFAARNLALNEDSRVLATLDPRSQQEWLRRLIGGGGTST